MIRLHLDTTTATPGTNLGKALEELRGRNQRPRIYRTTCSWQRRSFMLVSTSGKVNLMLSRLPRDVLGVLAFEFMHTFEKETPQHEMLFSFASEEGGEKEHFYVTRQGLQEGYNTFQIEAA